MQDTSEARICTHYHRFDTSPLFFIVAFFLLPRTSEPLGPLTTILKDRCNSLYAVESSAFHPTFKSPKTTSIKVLLFSVYLVVVRLYERTRQFSKLVLIDRFPFELIASLTLASGVTRFCVKVHICSYTTCHSLGWLTITLSGMDFLFSGRACLGAPPPMIDEDPWIAPEYYLKTSHS